MSFAFMPIYTGDYLRDTQHLSCSEHGIYFKLLVHCWDQRGPAPWDERKLAGIVNARSADEVEALRRVLGEFFVRMDDGWYNRRMMREVEKAAALSDKKSTAGKIGAAVTNSKKRKDIPARARHLPDTCSADARQEPHTPTTTITTTPTPTTTTTSTEFELSPFVDPLDSQRLGPACPVSKIIELWNSIVAAAGGQKALNLSKARRDMIARRWREVAPETVTEGLAWFEDVFRNRIAPSKFMTGREAGKDGRIYRIGIDVAMRSELQLDQIAEGKYA